MNKNYFADIPDFTYPNFRYFIDDIGEKFADREAMRIKTEHDSTYRVWTFRELKDNSYRIARFLYFKGMKKGDRIGLLSENRPEWGEVYFAAVLSGLVIVPIDVSMDPGSIGNIARQAETKVFFYSEKYDEKLPFIKDSCPSLEMAVNFDKRPRNGRDSAQGKDDIDKDAFSLNYRELVEKDWEAHLPNAEDITSDDMASIIFTSGTTGLSKGVMLSHRGIIANVSASILSLPIYDSDVFVLVLPLHHTYPTTCSFLSPMIVGGSVTIVDRLVSKIIISNIKDTGGSVLIGIPLLFDKMKQSIESRLKELHGIKKIMISLFMGISKFFTKVFRVYAGKVLFKSLREKAGLGSLRLLVSGGGPLSVDTADFYDVLGLTIVQGYGMSENGPLISANTEKYRKHASVGLPVKYTDIKIDKPNDEGVGEIVVKSPSLMLGYYKNEKATKDIFTDEGYLRTGDLGRFDKDGFLYITGRSKNLLVTSGGKNVYPEEIEMLFKDSEIIKECVIMGRKESETRQADEVIAVCVPDFDQLKVLYPENKITDEFVARLIKAEIAAVNKNLPGYKKIQDFIIRNEEFEKTSSQKVKRYLYRDSHGNIKL